MAAKSHGEGQVTYVTTAEYDSATLPEVFRGGQEQGGQVPWSPEDIQQPDAQKDYQLPQAMPSEYQAQRTLPQLAPESDIQPYVPEKSDANEGPGQPTAPRPWWKRRLFVLIAVGIVILIGLVVGLAVGLTRGSHGIKSSSQGASSTQTATPTNTEDTAFGTPTTFSAAVTSQPSSCRGTVCPSMLATAQLADDTKFFIFGRGDDKAIWYRFANSTEWGGDWESLGGSFDSQPVAASLGSGRVDVLATWTDGSIRSKTYQDSKWTSDWLNLGGDSVSPPAVCSAGNNAMEVFGTTEDHGLMHRSYNGSSWDPALDRDWDTWGGYISASPVAVCSGPGRIDVVSYGGTSSMLHDVGWMHYINGSWESWDGNSTPSDKLGYRGDPALIALDNQSADFFGVGTDKQLYHVSWSLSSNYTQTENLGGSLESTPYVLVTGSDRLDVLAVGTDDKLMHKARVGGTWSTDWEDLGGYFNSVPLATSSGDNWIAVFGLGPDGRVIHGNWSTTDSFVWGQGGWFDDGGDLSSTWFRAGPAR